MKDDGNDDGVTAADAMADLVLSRPVKKRKVKEMRLTLLLHSPRLTALRI